MALDDNLTGRSRNTKAFRESEPNQAARDKMTGAQASYLKMLAEEGREPSAFDRDLSEREALRRIAVLSERLRLGDLPPHTD